MGDEEMSKYPWEPDEVEWVHRVSLCARNVPVVELNNICLLYGGFLDVKEEEVVLLEVKVVERV